LWDYYPLTNEKKKSDNNFWHYFVLVCIVWWASILHICVGLGMSKNGVLVFVFKGFGHEETNCAQESDVQVH
jgi:hypothetical protein